MNHRLRATYEDRGRNVCPAARAIGAGRARSIVFDPAVGDAEIALMRLDHVEAIERSFDGSLSTAVGDVGMVDAGL